MCITIQSALFDLKCNCCHREETAHLVLSPMIEALESVASQLAGDRPIQAVEMSVAHVLHQIQIILKSIVEWSGESLEDAQQPNMV